MLRKNQLYLDRGKKIPADTGNDIPQAKNIVTLVARQTKGDLHMAESHRVDITQQALSIVPANSKSARRADYIAAGIIVTVLGSWLGSAVLKSRVVTVLIYVLLIVFSAILAGVVLGALLGMGFIQVDPIQALLLVIAGAAILVMGVGLNLVLHWSHQPNPRTSVDETEPQEILIPVRELNPQVRVPVEEVGSQTFVPAQVVNSRVLVPVDQVTPPVLVPVEEVNSQEFVPEEETYLSQEHTDRRKTDWT